MFEHRCLFYSTDTIRWEDSMNDLEVKHEVLGPGALSLKASMNVNRLM